MCPVTEEELGAGNREVFFMGRVEDGPAWVVPGAVGRVPQALVRALRCSVGLALSHLPMSADSEGFQVGWLLRTLHLSQWGCREGV